MRPKFWNGLFILLLIMGSLSTTFLSLSAYRIPEEKKFVILIDEGHSEIFKLKDFIYGFQILNKSLPLKVYSINSTIDDKALTGVDLLVIPPMARGASFGDEEVKAISRFLENGGSLLILTSTNKSSHIGPTNILLGGIKIDDSYLGDSIQFLLVGGERVQIYDNFHNYLSPEIVKVNISNLYKALGDVFSGINDSLYVSTIALNILDESNFVLLEAEYTAYGIDINNKVHFTNSSPIVGALKKYSESTRVAILGFTEPFTNRTAVKGLKWIDLGANLEFFEKLITWLLRPEIFAKENVIKPTYLHIYLIISSIIMISFAQIVYKIEEKKEKRKEKEKEEVKISEVLKKLREKK